MASLFGCVRTPLLLALHPWLSVSGDSRSRLCRDGPRIHLSGPATCLVAYVQKSDFHSINDFNVVIVVKKCSV